MKPQSVIAADGVKPRSKHITKGQLSNGHQLGSSVNSSVFVIDLHMWLVWVCPCIVPDNLHRKKETVPERIWSRKFRNRKECLKCAPGSKNTAEDTE
ncbi:uncharacterized protein LOC144807075 isoform X3 [Lissotriton helveticus]